MIGEIGGSAEEDAAALIKASGTKKPVVGVHRRPHRAARAAHGPRRRDHLRRQGAAEEKIAALREAGIKVADSPATIGQAMREAMGGSILICERQACMPTLVVVSTRAHFRLET